MNIIRVHVLINILNICFIKYTYIIHVYMTYTKWQMTLTNTSYYILTCIEHIRAHIVISTEGNAKKIVQVIQRQREQ